MAITDIREVKCGKDPKEILATLDSVRQQIIAGEVVGIMAVLDHANGTYTTIGSGSPDCRRTVAGLFELAVRRMGFEYRKDI